MSGKSAGAVLVVVLKCPAGVCLASLGGLVSGSILEMGLVMPGFAYTLPGFKQTEGLDCSERDFIRNSRSSATWSQYSLQRRSRGAGSAIDAATGGFSNV